MRDTLFTVLSLAFAALGIGLAVATSDPEGRLIGVAVATFFGPYPLSRVGARLAPRWAPLIEALGVVGMGVGCGFCAWYAYSYPDGSPRRLTMFWVGAFGALFFGGGGLMLLVVRARELRAGGRPRE